MRRASSQARSGPLPSVDFVPGDPGERHRRGRGSLDHPLGELSLGRELGAGGDPGRRAAALVIGPGPRQVQLAVDEGVPARRGVAEAGSDLGVPGSARRCRRTGVAHPAWRASRCCIPSGDGSPACSAMVQQFLRGSSASRPSTNARARRRGSTRRNRLPVRVSSSSSTPSHRPGSTLGPAATRRSSRVVTNRDDQTVAAPVSSTGTPKTTLYG